MYRSCHWVICRNHEGEFTPTARLPVPLNKCDFHFMSWQQFLSTNWILCAIIIATCIWKFNSCINNLKQKKGKFENFKRAKKNKLQHFPILYINPGHVIKVDEHSYSYKPKYTHILIILLNRAIRYNIYTVNMQSDFIICRFIDNTCKESIVVIHMLLISMSPINFKENNNMLMV